MERQLFGEIAVGQFAVRRKQSEAVELQVQPKQLLLETNVTVDFPARMFRRVFFL